MADETPFKILFLCTGNSARSILGEYLLRRLAPRQFETFSAGSNPTGKVNPYAVRVLQELYEIDASDASSKSWEQFKDAGLDFVITVCDHASETCPIFPGQPIVAHWGMPDPAAVTGSDEEIFRAFKQTASELYRRLDLFCNLPLSKLHRKLDRLRLEQLTQEISSK